MPLPHAPKPAMRGASAAYAPRMHPGHNVMAMAESQVPHGSLPAAVVSHAGNFPGRPALIFRHGGTEEDEVLTYADLARQASQYAVRLRRQLAPGARVMLALPTGREWVVAFVACQAAGMVPVPIPVPDGYSSARRRTAGIARDCGAELVLAARADLPAVSQWAADSGLGALTCETVPPAGEGQVPGPAQQAADPTCGEDLAFLQYTSGSTGDPKGVMVTHRNLVANADLLRRRLGLDAGTRCGGWIPLYHDMGLVALLCTPLLIGSTCVLMPATAFLRRPVDWLRLVSQHRLDMSPAPNFAYDLCVRTVTPEQIAQLDLSAWRCAVNGSEPVHAPTMAAFAAKFAAAGLRPEAITVGYGMAEATVFVSAKAPGTPVGVLTVDAAQADRGFVVPDQAGARALVSCGVPEGFDVRIVDPATRQVLPEGQTGEIWLRGPSVTRGYWRRPAATAATFAAVTSDGEAGWLRTGDVGALRQGELYVTGRLKEMLIVHGRNLFPQDLEQEARAAHPALAGLVGAAFGVAAPDERPVIVHEVNARAVGGDLAQVAEAITARLTTALAIPARNVVLVRRGGVRRTTSGKIERTTMRQLFLAGSLPVLHAALDPAVVRMLPAPALTAAGSAR
jgi:acyl-CoA synthetase (AMP-forming)/AMP-acid ligase II